MTQYSSVLSGDLLPFGYLVTELNAEGDYFGHAH